MNMESSKNKGSRRQRDQLEIQTQMTGSLRELERLLGDIRTGVKALSQRNSERMLGLSTQIDMVEGPTQRMAAIIEGLLRSAGK